MGLREALGVWPPWCCGLLEDHKLAVSSVKPTVAEHSQESCVGREWDELLVSWM